MPNRSKPFTGFSTKGYFDQDAGWTTIHRLKSEGVTITKIAALTHCDRKTVRYQLSRPPPTVRTRAPSSKATPAAKRKKSVKSIVGHKKKNGLPKHNSVRELKWALKSIGIRVSKSTVLRDLHKLDMKYLVRPVCAAGAATPDVWRDKRLEAGNSWASASLNAAKMYFSDEKMFYADDGERCCWVAEGEEAPVFRKCRWSAKVHVWGVIGHNFRMLLFLDGLQNSASYIVTLTKFLAAYRHGYVFMQDGASCHTSGETKEWLALKNITVLSPWPPNSPDLNPIENLWSVVAKKVEKRMPCSGVEELKQIVRAEWNSVEVPLVNGLVASFPRRVAAMQSAKGESCQI